MENKIKIGDKFGRLTICSEPCKINNTLKVLTRCVCGTEKYIRTYHILKGTTVSCGCYGAEQRGKAKGAQTHGLSKTPEYTIWRKMKERCYSINCKEYKYYGGRGIKICDRWLENKGRGMSNFLKDMGERPSKKHSIDRINVNGDYTPENCRWVNIYVQANNKRSNNYLTYKNKTQTLTQWAKELNLEAKTLFTRIYDGWPVEKALSTPTIRPTEYVYNKKKHTLKEWSDILNISVKNLESRFVAGWSVEKAFSTPIKKPLKISYRGISKTTKEWCTTIGCSRAVIEKRIRKGLTPEEALQEVIKKYNFNLDEG